MNDNHQDKPTAVMLTVDAGNISMSTLDLAVAMAASAQSRLHGLFIENEDLLRAASLPFTREISVTTARVHQTDFDKMQQALQTMARQFRKSLEQAAQASQVPWSFDYVSDGAEENRLQTQPDVSYLIVGKSMGRRADTRQYQPLRRVLLIENQSPHLIHALDVVLRKFGRQKVEVTAIAPADQDIDENSALQQFIKNSNQSVMMLEMKRDRLATLLSQAGAMFDCAIFSRHEDAENKRLILNSLRCPAIMVS